MLTFFYSLWFNISLILLEKVYIILYVTTFFYTYDDKNSN